MKPFLSLPIAAALGALIGFGPVAAIAGGPQAVTSEAPVAAPVLTRPSLSFSLGAGVGAGPSYFGSDDLSAGPVFSVGIDSVNMGGGLGYTSGAYGNGLKLRGSFRHIGKREASEHAELTGMDDIGSAVELGLRLTYRQDNYALFGTTRYGVTGHNALVGELGADLIMRPSDALSFRVGPRLDLGSDRFASTYFGVTADEEVSSGIPEYDAKGGLMSAGIELGAGYSLNDRWRVDGTVSWDRLLNDAADSPITALGSADQFGVRVELVRRFTLNF